MDGRTLEKIEELIKNTEIKIEDAYYEDMEIDIFLPYESESIVIKLEGDDDESIIESFKEEVNHHLNRMIDHLNDCKLD